MDEAPSYAEWLAANRRTLQALREGSNGETAEERTEYGPNGHPLNQPLPATGDVTYDARQPRRQAHGTIAREMAGFSPRELERIRDVLDAGGTPELPPGWTLSSSERPPSED